MAAVAKLDREAKEAWLKSLRGNWDWSVEDARAVLAEWGKTGLTLQGFALTHGLSPDRLREWWGKLECPAPTEATRFIGVQVVQPLVEERRRPGGSPPGAETVDEPATAVLWVAGRRVHVYPGFDGHSLLRLVKLLEGARGC